MSWHVRGYGDSNECEPTGEDHEMSTKRDNTQYPDDDAQGMVQLDYCRLYLPQLPNDLRVNDTLCKFGSLTEVTINKVQWKREAKSTMMQLYRAQGPQPLSLTRIAHKKWPKTNHDIYNNNAVLQRPEWSTFKHGVNDNRGNNRRKEEYKITMDFNTMSEDELEYLSKIAEVNHQIAVEKLEHKKKILYFTFQKRKARARAARNVPRDPGPSNTNAGGVGTALHGDPGPSSTNSWGLGTITVPPHPKVTPLSVDWNFTRRSGGPQATARI